MDPTASGQPPADRRFKLALTGIALLALGVRLGYGEAADLPRNLGDDFFYHSVANTIADGRGFVDPFKTLVDGRLVDGTQGRPIPTAFHPPLFPALLAVGSLLGADSYHAHQAIGCLFGAGTVAAIGLIGRRVGGAALGLAVALAGALYLPLVANDALLLSESLYGLTIALVMLLALRLHERPEPGRAVALGLAIGAAALTRSEGLLLAAVLVPFVVWRAPRRGRLVLAAAAATLLLVVPWSVRNTLAFDRFVPVATNGGVEAGANTRSTYFGDKLGGWDIRALDVPPPPGRDRYNEAVRAARLRADGLRYAADHAGRLPVVVAARIARTWSIYPWSPRQKVDFASFEGAHVRRLEWVLLASFAVALVLSPVGLRALRRRGVPLAPFVAPILLITAVSAVFYGHPRFRQTAEPALVVLAGAGVASLAGRRAPRRGRSPIAPH